MNSNANAETQPSWFGSSGRFRNKIYVGNLSSRTREDDIRDVFEQFGRVINVILKYDFAFVEMEDDAAMEEAINNLDGYEMDERRWIVEHTRRGPRDNNGRNPNNVYRRPAGMRPSRGQFKVFVLGLSSATSWQDLKDWGRQAGESLMYGDVFVDRGRRTGILEYERREDFDYAFKHLNNDRLHGRSLRVYRDSELPPIDDASESRPHRGSGRQKRSHHSGGHRRSRRHRSLSRSLSRSDGGSDDKLSRSRSRSYSDRDSYSDGSDIDNRRYSRSRERDRSRGKRSSRHRPHRSRPKHRRHRSRDSERSHSANGVSGAPPIDNTIAANIGAEMPNGSVANVTNGQSNVAMIDATQPMITDPIVANNAIDTNNAVTAAIAAIDNRKNAADTTISDTNDITIPTVTTTTTTTIDSTNTDSNNGNTFGLPTVASVATIEDNDRLQ